MEEVTGPVNGQTTESSVAVSLPGSLTCQVLYSIYNDVNRVSVSQNIVYISVKWP